MIELSNVNIQFIIMELQSRFLKSFKMKLHLDPYKKEII